MPDCPDALAVTAAEPLVAYARSREDADESASTNSARRSEIDSRWRLPRLEGRRNARRFRIGFAERGRTETERRPERRDDHRIGQLAEIILTPLLIVWGRYA
ncbi:hypothetical protein [Haladaptatus salinisoli]|uniref:hypothetical protein n=1 Tax=Haladaptatus salinisoli TaxID=2884876 RepID=UPI001D09D6C4|nr:hypothetical protein [Haladaptatus salinisoli]